MNRDQVLSIPALADMLTRRFSTRLEVYAYRDTLPSLPRPWRYYIASYPFENEKPFYVFVHDPSHDY